MAPISYFQATVLGLVQGIAEPFPISSLGHGVILPSLFGWNIHQNDDYFLAFLVATHVATALVLLLIFRHDWARILRGLGRSLRDREIAPGDTDARLGWLLVVGTIPAGALGLLLENSLRALFASAASAAAFLILNGVLLLLFERVRRRPPHPGDYRGDSDARIARLSWRQALGVGTSAAGLLKLPDLLGSAGNGVRGQAAVGAVCAAVATYFAVKFLPRFFETNRLTPFGIYCIAMGLVCTVVFALS